MTYKKRDYIGESVLLRKESSSFPVETFYLGKVEEDSNSNFLLRIFASLSVKRGSGEENLYLDKHQVQNNCSFYVYGPSERGNYRKELIRGENEILMDIQHEKSINTSNVKKFLMKIAKINMNGISS